MWQYKHTDELYHFGIPGMKWGKRKAKRERSENVKNLNKKISKLNSKKNKIEKQLEKHEITKKQAVRKISKIEAKKIIVNNKKERIKSSRYGKTNFNILVDAGMKSLSTQFISKTAEKTATQLGKHKTAAAINMIGSMTNAGIYANTAYKIARN